MCFFKSNERSIGLGDYFFKYIFSGISRKTCSRSILIFRGLTCDYFLNSVHFIDKRKANSTIEQQKSKRREKRDRLLISKIEINYQISQRNKSFTFDPVFSN